MSLRARPPGLRLPASPSKPILLALVAVLLLLAGLRLWPGYRALLFVAPAVRSEYLYISIGRGAVDLMARRFETQDFFSGRIGGGRVYPPATYAMLWPFIASSTIPVARWTWAVVLTASLAWICVVCARASGFADPLARLAMGLMPLGFLATSAALRTGQLTLAVLALLFAFLGRLARRPRSQGDEWAAAVLFTMASLKPTLNAPVGWLLLFLPRSLRPAMLAAGLYAALTGLALAIRGAPEGYRMRPSAQRPNLLLEENMFAQGYANLQNWLVQLGIGVPWVLLPPILSLVAVGWWTWRHRRDDPWVLLAVACLVARLAFYHRIYDDLLVLPAMVALARLASGASVAAETPAGGRVETAAEIPTAALWTLLASAFVMLMPASIPVALRIVASTGVWWAALCLLLVAATRSPRCREGEPLQIRGDSLT